MGEREALGRRLAIYLVSPDAWGTRPDDEARLRRLLEAGVGTVQFRDKSDAPERQARAQAMRDLCAQHQALFLVNDHPELALAVGADGVHVGESDASVASARALLGPLAIIGATARTTARAISALAEGADYLGVGAMFDARASKADAITAGPELLLAMRERPELSDALIVAIGGIDAQNAPECFDAGADGVAMIRGLWASSDPEAWIPELRALARR